MRKGTRHLGCVAVLFMSIGCADGFRVYPASKTSADMRYLYYALPRTVLVVTVPVTKTARAPGDCTVERLAAEIAGVAPPPSAPPPSAQAPAKPGGTGAKAPGEGAPPPPPDKSAAREKAERALVEAGITAFDAARASDLDFGDAELTSRAEPDPDHVYAVALTSSLLTGNKYGFELSDQGVLGSASLESTSVVVDYTVKTLGAAASVAGSVIAFGGAAAQQTTCRGVLDELKKLRSARRDLVEGKANTQGLSKEALEVMLSELKSIERDFVARFEGRTSTRQGTIVCEVTPAASADKPIELFSFTTRGVSLAASGCFVPNELWDTSPHGDSSDSSDPSKVALALRRVAVIADRARPIEGEDGDDGRGLYYRIPGQAVVDILRTEQDAQKRPVTHRLGSARLDVAQFGRVATLPGEDDAGAASLNYTVKLNPTTGGIMSYGATAEAPGTSGVDAAGTAGTTVLEAVKAKVDRDAQAEISALEQEKKRLELLRDIQKLRGEIR
jgi:hypothetical protein